MRLITLLIVLTFATNLVSAQTQISNFKTQFKLPEKVKETSGLLFLNGKIITHNDSGNEPNLYEIDSLSGDLLRTISVSNATNIDWEDLAEDETHLYIADIGNNNGNRKDLKIYKVLKTDFKNNAAVEAEVISYSYEDQTSYTTQTNASNFDAEGIVVYHNNLLIFTKNWTNLKTNVYKIPTLSGSYVASKISSANVAGLITGAVFNQDRFFLTGYSNVLKPFLIYISPNRKPGEDIFFSGFTKISLEDKLSQGSQIEGITNIGITGKYYISREAFTTTISDTSFSFPQKLYQFYDDNTGLLSVERNSASILTIHPNPTKRFLHLNSNSAITALTFYNILGAKTYNLKNIQQHSKIDISLLPKGIYYLKIELKEDEKPIIKKSN